MSKIEFPAKFTLGEEGIVAAEVRHLNFSGFVDVARSALALRDAADMKYEVALQRERLKAQVFFLTEGGKKITVATTDQLTGIPASAARLLIPALSGDAAAAGKVLQDGDGIDKPILYQLGTPIKMTKSGKEIAIPEIEFIARTYGEIEEILAGDTALFQALDLLRTVAKPVSSDTTLTTFPSWAVDQVTLADGLFVAQTILPRFLG